MTASISPVRATEIRQKNSMLVLSAIYSARNNGGISQTEVINKTGLTAASVFRIFSKLEEEGYIIPCSTRTVQKVSKKGRHPSFYTVLPSALYTVGIEFWSAFLSLGVFDFNSHRIYSCMESLKDGINSDELIDLICQKTDKALSELKISTDKIEGIGVAAPGKVDVKSGSVIFYPRIKGMDNLPLKKILSERMKYRITVHNNCSALAYSIYRHSDKSTGNSIFTFLIRGGINGAMVSENGIYTDAEGTTLEAGHIPVSSDGPLCSCGQTGCLQAHLKEICSSDEPVLFNNISSQNIKKINACAVYIYRCMKIIQRTLSPDTFFIVCPSIFTSEAITEEVRKLYADSKDYLQSKIPDIFALAYDNSLVQTGASDLALDNFFADHTQI